MRTSLLISYRVIKVFCACYLFTSIFSEGKLVVKMGKVKTLKYWLICMVALYAFGGVSLRYINPENPEVFPVFAWYLFSSVPYLRIEYSIEILEYDQSIFDPPLQY